MLTHFPKEADRGNLVIRILQLRKMKQRRENLDQGHTASKGQGEDLTSTVWLWSLVLTSEPCFLTKETHS